MMKGISLQVEIWSDVVCPWCYIGKVRFEKALAEFAHADEVEVVWRSFQLNPQIPKGERQPIAEYLAAKTGGSIEQAKAMNDNVSEHAASEGLSFDFDRYTVINTFDAHRLTQLAKEHNLGAEMHARLLRAQLVEGEVLDEPATLVRMAVDTGIPEDEARRVAESDEYADDVNRDVMEMQMLGGNGVPFFVLDRRYGVSGAQPVEVFLNALQQAYDSAG